MYCWPPLPLIYIKEGERVLHHSCSFILRDVIKRTRGHYFSLSLGSSYVLYLSLLELLGFLELVGAS
jgi:hypothetical protein